MTPLETRIAEIEAREKSITENHYRNYCFQIHSCSDIPFLLQALKVYREALEQVKQISGALQPNSGHMYLSDINRIDKIAAVAIVQVELMAEEK